MLNREIPVAIKFRPTMSFEINFRFVYSDGSESEWIQATREPGILHLKEDKSMTPNPAVSGVCYGHLYADPFEVLEGNRDYMKAELNRERGKVEMLKDIVTAAITRRRPR